MKTNAPHNVLKSRRLRRRIQPGDAIAGLQSGSSAPRDASTLLIVMVLLGMLSLIGFLFYSFAAGERSAASYWADSQKKVGQTELDSEALMDWALQQIIVGPNDTLTHSALYGGRHSLLPNMFGRDIHPYNSAGIHLITDNGEPLVDMNYDGIADSVSTETPLGQEPLNFNDSGAIDRGAGVGEIRDLTDWPDPGVDYTYPDINNPFLAYKGYTVGPNGYPVLPPNGGNPLLDRNAEPVPVIIPSFHRPQLLRTTDGAPVADWYSNPLYAGRVLRPHPSHLNPNGTTRFPTNTAGTTLTTTFPFAQVAGAEGVWSLTTPYAYGHESGTTRTTVPDYGYDVDNDGDTTNEGIWMDLGYPPQTNGAGQTFVPLFSATIYDADGLLNLNAHGNLAALADVTEIGDIDSLTRFLAGSNQGNSPFEINPLYALNSVPNTDPTFGDFSGTSAALTTALQQHTFQYGWTPNNNVADTYDERIRLANMEWYRLVAGTANFQSATEFSDLFPGRNGEPFVVLYPGLLQGIANGSVSQTPVSQMPFPGVTGLDDNWNQYEGAFAWELNSGTPGFAAINAYQYQYNSSYAPKFYPYHLTYYAPYPYGQPLDFDGNGTIAGTIAARTSANPTMVLTTGQTGGSAAACNYGKTRLMIRNVYAPFQSLPYPTYLRYDNPGGVTTYQAAGTSDSTNLNSVGAGWHDGAGTLGGEQMTYPYWNGTAWIAVPYLDGSSTAALPLAQLDEAFETIVDTSRATSSDAIFDASEIAGLHLSTTDQTALSLSSRPQILMPFNFGDSARAVSIRQQFTTESWDRKQYGYAGRDLNYVNSLPSPTDSTIYMPLPGYAIPGDHLIYRPWEMSDTNTDLIRETFPPVFGTVAAYSPTDPFRSPVRQVLSMTMGNTTPSNQIQFRLSINHLTTTDSSGNVIQRALTPHDPALTEAAVVFGSGSQEDDARRDRQQMARDIYVMLYTFGGGLDFATQNDHGGSMVGAGGYTGDNSAFDLYNARQLREMAQFAVNVVDALDPDRVMTKFEYDKNLGNGWNLNDNAYAPHETGSTFTAYTAASHPDDYNADYPEDSDERGVVYGAEAQEITLNEVLAFYCPEVQNASNTGTTDHAATAHDDEFNRYFTYLELRNVGTTGVTFDGQYRIRVIPEGGIERRLTLMDDTISAGDLYTIGNAGQDDSGPPAALKSVDMSPAPTAPDDLNHSRFRCDNSNLTGAVDFTNSAAWIAPPQQELDLDLIVHHDNGKFKLHDTLGTTDDSDDVDITDGPLEKVGGLLNETTWAIATPETQSLTFVLERRQYPDRPAVDPLDDNDNAWVPVDRFELQDGEYIKFGLTVADTMRSEYDTRLQALLSKERIEPLQRASSYDLTRETTHDPAIVSNSLMDENQKASADFALYLTVFDRPFASPVELFDIPLYGPQNVTLWTGESVASANNPSPYSQTTEFSLQFQAATTAGSQNEIPTAATAVGKFLQPEHITNVSAAPGSKTPALDNRWYRLLEFFEVPTRMHRQLGNPLEIVRQPSKLNLSTIRHPAVLAGLLDDTDVMSFDEPSSSRQKLYALDTLDQDLLMDTGTATPNTYWPLSSSDLGYQVRDWWVQFLKSRDGRTSFDTGETDANGNLIPRKLADNVTNLYLPGLADSSPFRSFATLGYSNPGSAESPEHALDKTLFRRLPIDLQNQTASAALTDKRHLWEVGTATDHAGGASGTPVDSVMRHRLLSKIYNNTTTRSHVFIVFITVRMFEADDTDPDNVRIGGELTGGATYRGFFVIDRSQPEDAYDSATNTFSNFRELIKYRLTLE